jgi:hypothetical protein
VHGSFEAAGQRLAELVSSHQQAFARAHAGGVEFALLGVRAVIREAVLSVSSRLLLLDLLERRRDRIAGCRAATKPKPCSPRPPW